MKKPCFEQLNKIIIFEKPNKMADGFGGFEVDWHEFSRTWAMMAQLNNGGLQVRTGNFNKSFYKFIIRFCDNFTLNMRINYRNRYFKIEAVNNIGNDYKFLEFITYERIKYATFK